MSRAYCFSFWPGCSSPGFKKDELTSWVETTWGFAKQIFPLLAIGVIVAGFLLGRPGHPALIPEKYIVALVGGNSLWANLTAFRVSKRRCFCGFNRCVVHYRRDDLRRDGMIGTGN